MPIHLYVVYGCFHTTKQSCDRDQMSYKAQNIYYLPF